MSNEQVITSLTPEQEALLQIYYEKYLKIALSTNETNKQKIEQTFKDFYKQQKLEEPVIIWEDSPIKGAKKAAALKYHPAGNSLPVDEVLKTLPVPTQAQIDELASQCSYGTFNAYWVSYYAFINDVLPVPKDPNIDTVKDITEEVGVYWMFKRAVVVTEKPIKICLKDSKLHSLDGKALEYRDGSGLYAVEGKIGPSILAILADSKLENVE